MLDRDFANPYAAPAADLTAAPVRPPDEIAEAEAIRRRYLGHEASVKSVGSLYYLGAFFGIIGTVALVALALNASRVPNVNPNGPALMWGMAGFYLLMTALNFVLGRGISRLRPWARWTVIVFSALGLLYILGVGGYLMTQTNVIAGAIPMVIGGGITGYILYLMASAKGAMVFSPDYKAIIALTPHIKYKSSLIVKVFLVLVVVIVIIAIVAGVMNR